MTTNSTLILITVDPSHALAHHALRYCKAFCENYDSQNLSVFFYGQSARVANRLNWNSAEQLNLTNEWQQLSAQYNLTLPVCVSTALSRGISDVENSKRHKLDTDNLAVGFELVGLGVLADLMQGDVNVIQF